MDTQAQSEEKSRKAIEAMPEEEPMPAIIPVRIMPSLQSDKMWKKNRKKITL